MSIGENSILSGYNHVAAIRQEKATGDGEAMNRCDYRFVHHLDHLCYSGEALSFTSAVKHGIKVCSSAEGTPGTSENDHSYIIVCCYILQR